MSQPLISDILSAIEDKFPPQYQEDFDNTGLQLGRVDRTCSGVLLCVDLTPQIIDEAIARGCNLIITHHPLIFHPLKKISGEDRVSKSVYDAIRADISVYSCHTSVDNTPRLGVSWEMGRMLGLSDIQSIEQRGPQGIGCGIVGNLNRPLSALQLVDKVKATFSSPIARCSIIPKADTQISRIGLCGGAGSFLIPQAIHKGAQAFITSDSKYNTFIDHTDSIFLIDIGHFESEECTKNIFLQTIKEKFPNFALYYSQIEKNPINYL